MTCTHLRAARQLATQVDGSDNPVHWRLNKDRLCEAFVRLNTSNPSSPALRQMDMTLARAILDYVGRISAND